MKQQTIPSPKTLMLAASGYHAPPTLRDYAILPLFAILAWIIHAITVVAQWNQSVHGGSK
jgi:hypothetical protein